MERPDRRPPRAQSRSVADLMVLMMAQGDADRAAPPPKRRVRLPFGLGLRTPKPAPRLPR